MKISLNWLSSIINTESIDIDTLTSKLTLAGFEVEDIEYLKDSSDVVIDIVSPANRGDTLSMVGIAREIAAIYDISYITKTRSKAFFLLNDHEIYLKQLEDCLFYSITIFDNIRVKPSPLWLQNFLKSIGLIPENNLRDILNYILFEYGQPIEAYDIGHFTPFANKALKFKVTHSLPKTSFFSCQDEEFILDPINLISQLNEQSIGVSGIIGSKNTHINSMTNFIALETAIFQPKVIRQSSQKLNIKNESSIRFERTLNPDVLSDAYHRTLELITELCEANIRAANYVNKMEILQKQINLRLKNLTDILGNSHYNLLDVNKVDSILEKLGFPFTRQQENWVIQIPNHRLSDIEQEIDIIEEIGRIQGFNQFPHILPTSNISVLSFRHRLITHIRSFFIGKGFHELIHYSFQKTTSSFNPANALCIANPLVNEQEVLRDMILPEITSSFFYNIAQGNPPFSSFEIGRVFTHRDGKFLEQESLAGLLSRNSIRSNWSDKKRELNWFEAKGIIESFFSFLGIPITWSRGKDSIYYNDSFFHKFRSAKINSDCSDLGVFGQIHPYLAKKNGINSSIYLFEFNLEQIIALCCKQQYSNNLLQLYSIYPLIYRDINILTPLTFSISTIVKYIKSINNPLLRDVILIDDYRDSNFSELRRLSFRLYYRSNSRTLQVEEIDEITQQIRALLQDQLDIKI